MYSSEDENASGDHNGTLPSFFSGSDSEELNINKHLHKSLTVDS